MLLEHGLQTARGPNSAREDILQIRKNNTTTINSLIWQNVTFREAITLCKMSGPRAKKFGEPCRAMMKITARCSDNRSDV